MGTCAGGWRIVTYLRICALCPTRANVPAQRTQRMNAFAAARGDNDKTAMRPLTKLRWTLDELSYTNRQTKQERKHNRTS